MASFRTAVWGGAVWRAKFMDGSACGGGDIIIRQIVGNNHEFAFWGSRYLVVICIIAWHVNGW